MELQSDGRISNVELAARVNLSPAACLERVRKLHESGYIMGYTAQLNPQLLDVSLLVFIEVCSIAPRPKCSTPSSTACR
jgi:Lrp/AsnC family leucine-responsive transcriptional regulator